MGAIILYLAVLLLPLVAFFLNSLRAPPNLPPSPPRALPILGHFHLLKKPLHRTLAHLSQLHGSVLLLRFGSRLVLHVSSLPAALQCFTTLDLTFASRPLLASGKILGYNNTIVSMAPYGPHWRNLRRIATIELFSTYRVNALSRIRSEEVLSLAKWLAAETGKDGRFGKVEMRPLLFGVVMDATMRMVVGMGYHGKRKQEEAKELKEILVESFRLFGETNIGDFVPLLRWVAVFGVERRMRSLRARRDAFFKRVIEDRKKEMDDRQKRGVKAEVGRKTILDVLLSLQVDDPEYYTDVIIKGLIMTMLTAGTDTTATTIEWAMSVLLNHPQALLTAQAEIDKVVPSGEMVNELHLQDLPYLQAIISEALRLFPVGPLLIPHEASSDCTLEGYHVPRGTMLMVNAWAIHRDGSVWEEPTKFKPERFLHNEGNIKLLTFGMGRRSCPGESLARRMVGLILATLIQCFEWKRVGEEELDMREGYGLTMPREVPLEALCKVRANHSFSVAAL